MERTLNVSKEELDMEKLYSYLDKGIDDMEAGRVKSVEEAFDIIKERLRDEL